MVKLRDSYPLLSNGEIDLKNWISRISAFRQEEDVEFIYKACELAKLQEKACLTLFGESCFHQGLLMADILHDLGLDTTTVAAAIVYETHRYGKLSEKTIEKVLGTEVTKLVVGTLKMHSVHTDRQIQQTENLRKLLLAVVEDVRVVLIRLAEHSCDMRVASKLDEELRKHLAIETQEIYAPLANRLGIGQLKWELEDLAFRFLEPAAYKHIAKLLHERRVIREQYIDKAVQQISHALKKEGIEADVFGRVKHIYSIWKKMNRKGVGYHEIYDVRAVRILVSSIRDCYAALGIVHSLCQHIPKEFDDYIANPKDNGYRSLHTAVIGPEEKTLEVQIRTYDMHDQAELGVAAHWRYKEGIGRDTHYEIKLANLRQVLRWQDEWVTDIEQSDALRAEVFQDRVYVLTPKGKVLDLPLGSTVLDFAYHVHTEIGNRCRGAKVNGRIVPLTYTLKSGDQVEIVTAKTGGPSRDWLNPQFGYIKTVRARAKAHQWFKRQDREQNIVDGREVLERELKRLGVENIRFEQLANQLKFQKTEEMFAAIGGGDIRLNQVLGGIQSIVQPLLEKVQLPVLSKTPKLKESRSVEIMVAGVGNLLCQMARCCKPIPGDNIIGYISPGRGITIHRKDCPNILRVNEQKIVRLIPVEWGGKIQNLYAVDIRILGNDRQGLLRDVSAVFAAEHTNVITVQSAVNKSDNTVDFHFKVEITGIEQLGKLFTRIQQIPSIIDIRRVQQ